MITADESTPFLTYRVYVHGLGKIKHVDEYEARSNIERVYHGIRRYSVTGVNLNFRIWARHEKFFPFIIRRAGPNFLTLLTL
jgi:hypothetical protein